jgi:hypothetical protein
LKKTKSLKGRISLKETKFLKKTQSLKQVPIGENSVKDVLTHRSNMSLFRLLGRKDLDVRKLIESNEHLRYANEHGYVQRDIVFEEFPLRETFQGLERGK